ISGTVTINNITFDLKKTSNLKKIAKFSAFVPQHDVHIATLTAREDIIFNAVLRLSENIYTHEQKLQRAEEVIEMLDLQRCGNTYIGDEGIRGLSGGEKKRVSIGCELVTNPHFLILDELLAFFFFFF
ncbi:ATP-binding cassette transporter, subfamily G, partial [Reticulomyxa filosa]